MLDDRAHFQAYVDGSVYLADYPISYAGCKFRARMTLVRLPDGGLWLHSPGNIDAALKTEIDALGPVRFLVGPGNFHWMHLGAAARLFPDAAVYIWPGIERKDPALRFDGFLGDSAPDVWSEVFDQVLVRGTRFIWEVAFYHRLSKTLILTDLVECFGDATPGVGWLIKVWWKAVFRMWNKARPAPEYQIGWSDKKAARDSLQRILAWDFERVIIAHGDLIDVAAKDTVREAWQSVLRG